MASMKADHNKKRTPLEWDALVWHSKRSTRNEKLFRRAERRRTSRRLRYSARDQIMEGLAS